jgi:hypothetical protein
MANANYPLPKAYGPAATAADDVFDQSYARIYAGAGGGAKPGTPLVLFCNDPSFNGQWFVSSNNFCALAGDLIGAYGDLLSTSTSRVLQYLGFGDVLNLPLEARDRRYFFKRWSQAYAKYLTSPAVLATGNHGSGQVPDYSQTLIDTDHFIFDSFGGGASRSEYISFDFADSVHDPVSVEQKILVLGSNLQATNFYRKLDREERALYNSLAIDRTQAAWGYLHDKTTGATITDFWPVQGAAGNITCTTNAACQAINPAYVCDTAAPATSTNAGVCVRAYARKNGNPFLTNMTGSIAIITGAVNTVGQTWSAAGNPAPLDWFDPCNPTTGQTCATSADCTGQLTCCPTADPSGCTVNTCVPAKTAYYCATHIDGDCINAGSNLPPLDPNTGAMIVRENGKPFFEGYCGIWQKSPFALQPNAITDANLAGVVSGAKVVKTFPDEGEALVQMPSYKNPYVLDAKAVDPPIQVMVPWYPFQEGVGYPVMASGTRDVFVTTAQLDFTGQVVTPVMDIIPVVDTPCNTAADCPAGDSCPSDTKTCVDPNPTNPTPPYSFQLEAIETQDFLGDVFLCVDPVTSANRAGTSVPGDVLAAHMYTSAATVIDWLAAHPGAQDACQIVVRYSPYDNYPDFIQSSLNGVRLGVEQGAGYGRITDATVFAPGTGTVAPP